MKKGEQPEFSAKWWKSSQPKGLKSADKLEDALKAYEVSKKKLEAGGDEDAKAAKDALSTVETAVGAVISDASKDKKSPEMALTVDVTAENVLLATHGELGELSRIGTEQTRQVLQGAPQEEVDALFEGSTEDFADRLSVAGDFLKPQGMGLPMPDDPVPSSQGGPDDGTPTSESDIPTQPGDSPSEAITPRGPISQSDVPTQPGDSPSQAITPREPISQSDVPTQPGDSQSEAITPREPISQSGVPTQPDDSPSEAITPREPISQSDVPTQPGDSPSEAITPREPISQSDVPTQPGDSPSEAITPRLSKENGPSSGRNPAADEQRVTLRSPTGPEPASEPASPIEAKKVGSVNEAIEPYAPPETLPNPVGPDGAPQTLRSPGTSASNAAADVEAGSIADGATGAEASLGSAAGAGLLGAGIAGGFALVGDVGKVKRGEMSATDAAADVGEKAVVTGGLVTAGAAAAKTLAVTGAKGGGVVGAVVGVGLAVVDDVGKVQSGQMTGGAATADVAVKGAVGAAAGFAGAAAGAEIGLAAGSVVPGIGNAVGFVAGALVGGIVGYVGSELTETDTGKAATKALGDMVDSAIDGVKDAGSALADAVSGSSSGEKQAGRGGSGCRGGDRRRCGKQAATGRRFGGRHLCHTRWERGCRHVQRPSGGG